MNSSADDDFSPNPFRSGGGGDLFGAPNPQTQQQPQQNQQQFNQQPQFQQQQFQSQQQQQQQQHFQSGGSDLFAPVQQQQQPPPPQNATAFQAPMTGPMDNHGAMQQQQQQQQQMQMQPRSWWGSCMMCLTLDAYRAYFDIDADDIVNRMKSAVLDCYKPDYFRNEVVGTHKTGTLKGPDLYGPFWITMTLIFFVAVSNQ